VIRAVPIRLKGNRYDTEATTFYRGVRASWLLSNIKSFPVGTTLASILVLYETIPSDSKGAPSYILAYPEFFSNEFTIEDFSEELKKVPPDSFVWTRFACGIQYAQGDADYFHIKDYWDLPKKDLVIAKSALSL